MVDMVWSALCNALKDMSIKSNLGVMEGIGG